MTPVVFADLDDTLFQTARKMSEEPHPDRLASVATNGHHSYMTAPQAAMMTWLADTTRLIPVTARSTGALGRCTLPFFDFRVAANGAVILRPDGTPDPEWTARISNLSRTYTDTLLLFRMIASELDGGGELRHWTVSEFGEDIYVCIKSNTGERKLDGVERAMRRAAEQSDHGPGAFTVHRNGNNLSVTPSVISKRAAVCYLMEGLDPETPVLGMGDSLTDLPFMEACQMMIAPTGSQIHSRMKETRDA